MIREISLRIILERPPQGVAFGVQKGRGNDYTTEQTAASRGEDLIFTIAVAVKDGGAGKGPALAGPYVQGPAGGRFLYLDIGTSAGQFDSPWTRRLKIPLEGIAPELLQSAAAIETRVPGIGRDGGPNCATVKPFAGWTLAK